MTQTAKNPANDNSNEGLSVYQNNFSASSSDQSRTYSDPKFYLPSMAKTTNQTNDSFYYETPISTFTTSPSNRVTVSPSSIMIQEPPVLVASSSSNTASTMSSSSIEFLNEAFAKATSLPESFYPEFLQYSKEAYEQSTGSGPHRKKQRSSDKKEEEQSDDEVTQDGLSSSELRRQIHIQSEQRRRAQIKDGFEELRGELPTCLNKKMSKVALLHRTVQHIQHLKDTQSSILTELERLVHENEQLKKFQDGVLQKQALENMYSMSSM
ncbi:hypothetical protein BY458DRAFT_507724 [Sporodiniella umbellata]|nr:hypothetical protein BY458DRAFT_507724 [Sporodiniella umbellata]